MTDDKPVDPTEATAPPGAADDDAFLSPDIETTIDDIVRAGSTGKQRVVLRAVFRALQTSQEKQSAAEKAAQKCREDCESYSNEMIAMSADIKSLKDQRDEAESKVRSFPWRKQADEAETLVWKGKYGTAMEVLKEAIECLGAQQRVKSDAATSAVHEAVANERLRNQERRGLEIQRDQHERFCIQTAGAIRSLTIAPGSTHGGRQRWMRENAALTLLGRPIVAWDMSPEYRADPVAPQMLSSLVTEGRAIVGELIRMGRSVGFDGTSVGERAAAQWLSNTAPLVPPDPIEIVPPTGRTQRRPSIDRERFSPRIVPDGPVMGPSALSPVDRPGKPGPEPKGITLTPAKTWKERAREVIDGKTYTEDEIASMPDAKDGET